jgi:hypothetical protein
MATELLSFEKQPPMMKPRPMKPTTTRMMKRSMPTSRWQPTSWTTRRMQQAPSNMRKALLQPVMQSISS